MYPENAVALWRAVLIRAMCDAVMPMNKYNRINVGLSRAWFRAAGPDYREVCELSAIDPEYMRAHVLMEITIADTTGKRRHHVHLH